MARPGPRPHRDYECAGGALAVQVSGTPVGTRRSTDPVVGRLREEHRAVARALTGIEELLTNLAAGTAAGPADAEKLRADLEGPASELETHFAYEEEHLFPQLRSSSAREPR
ncbi:hemerythrin domain-containing protein [Actinacidiphila soli]|uniref:hemerythrin domain-containing protein n=1 Tax=Actinacidiphila soli TaxID=2487275 RepID=UPI0013E3A452|nr:hemerythrin domain-containing protein [Actinacidiphila soli]